MRWFGGVLILVRHGRHGLEPLAHGRGGARAADQADPGADPRARAAPGAGAAAGATADGAAPWPAATSTSRRSRRTPALLGHPDRSSWCRWAASPRSRRCSSQAHAVAPPPGVKPYDPLRLAGKDVYVREGCYLCHSQMIRALRAETQRYGPYSVAAESVYDRPFQWGSKRTGPDLARSAASTPTSGSACTCVDPRAVRCRNRTCRPIRGSRRRKVDGNDIAARMRALRTLGDPYTDADIAGAPDGGRRQDRARRARRLSAGARRRERSRRRTRRNESALGTPGRRHPHACVLMLVFIGIWVWAWLPLSQARVRRAGESFRCRRRRGPAMSGFWSAWVIVLIVFNLGITLFLFLWGLRVDIPTQPDGTSGHVWAHGVLREGVRAACRRGGSCFRRRSFVAGFGYLALYPGLRRFQGRARLDVGTASSRATQAANRELDGAVARAHARQAGRGARGRPGGAARRASAVRRQLRGLPWPRRARQPRARRARPYRRRLALRRRRQGDPRQHHGRPPRRDAARSAGEMPDQAIVDLAHYVRSLSGRTARLAARAFGKPLFVDLRAPATAPTARATRRSARRTSPTASGSTAAASRTSSRPSATAATASCRRGATGSARTMRRSSPPGSMRSRIARRQR